MLTAYRYALVMLLCAAGVGLAGCHAEAPQDEIGHSEPASRFGVVALTYSEHPGPKGDTPQLVVSGVFARHAGLSPENIIDLLHLTDVPDAELLALKAPRCKYDEKELPKNIAPAANNFADLLDAGDVRLTLDGGDESLARRRLPDLFENISGVTYEAARNAPLTAGSTVQLEGRGSHDVGRFNVNLEVQPVPRILGIDNQPVLGGHASADLDDELTVRWLPAESVPDAASLVYIELAVLHFDSSFSLRCVTRDVGAATLPAHGVARVAEENGEGATVRLILRRISRSPLKAEGINTGDAFLVSRSSIVLH